MSGIRVNTTALATARAFLKKFPDPAPGDIHSPPADAAPNRSDEPDDAPVARPPRLGLGAKWVDARKGSTSGLGIAAIGARRLAASLKVESQATGAASDGDNDNNNGDDDGDDEESRARATLRASRKRKRRSSGAKALRQSAARLDDDKDSSGEKDKVEEDKEEKKDEDKVDAQDGQADNKAAGERVNMFDDLAVSGGGVAKKKKKKKVRSRQKNLRKDKRLKDSLPAHLTEETLRAGRVRRPADGGTRQARDQITSGADV